MTRPDGSARDGGTVVDVVCVGAGFAGLYACLQLTRAGFTVTAFEAAAGVGGTWRWNAYPGARCDIASHYYSYSFSDELQQEWRWTEKYAPQPEILAYLEHVADRFDLRRHYTFDTRVIGAEWLDDRGLWRISTDTGTTVYGRFFVSAAGVLSAPKPPDIPDIDDYAGITVFTSTWDLDIAALADKTVGIVGTGSSAVQCIPPIAEVAKKLVVFQRTPNYVMPARNEDIPEDVDRTVKSDYPNLRDQARHSHLGIPESPPTQGAFEVEPDERVSRYEQAYQVSGLTSVGSVFNDLMTSEAANSTAAEFLRRKVRETVTDPDTAALLEPRFHAFGAKRTCFGTDYYETFNRDNVELVSLRDTPLVAATRSGLRTTATEYELDALVMATGFDAVSGPLLRMNIATSAGDTLARAWSDGPRTYLGLMIAGFPNLFTVTGPQSPSVVSNVVISIEQHVDWLVALMVHMRDNNHRRFDVEPAAQDDWVKTVDAAVAPTLYATTESWYRGSNVDGKPNAFLAFVGGVGAYRAICDGVARNGYPGLTFDADAVHDVASVGASGSSRHLHQH